MRQSNVILQKDLRVCSRYWQKLISGARNPSITTLICILTDEDGGLGVRDIPTVNHFLALWDYAPLIESEVRTYKLVGSIEPTHDAARLVAHYPLCGNADDKSEHHNQARAVRVKYGVQDGRRGAILDG